MHKVRSFVHVVCIAPIQGLPSPLIALLSFFAAIFRPCTPILSAGKSHSSVEMVDRDAIDRESHHEPHVGDVLTCASAGRRGCGLGVCGLRLFSSESQLRAPLSYPTFSLAPRMMWGREALCVSGQIFAPSSALLHLISTHKG